ncbi:DUF1566 domain-containing protein [candidate division KSB1 bacterium]|nr:DUF1566 domain-containing protein [candidate division KSB1 bacterium]
MLEIITNFIIAIISSLVTLIIAIIGTRKKTEDFLNYLKAHRTRIKVIAAFAITILLGLLYWGHAYDQTDENPTRTLIHQIKQDTHEYTLLHLKYSQVTAEKDSLQNSYFLARAERDSLANMIAWKQNQKDDLVRQMDQKQNEKNKLHEQLQSQDPRNVNQIEILKFKINQLEVEIQTLKTQKDQLEKELEKLKIEKDGLNRMLQEITNSLLNSNRERQQLEMELKKVNAELTARIAKSDSVLRARAAKPGQFKLAHLIAWSPDKKWLAILYSAGKSSRLLVIDVNFRTGLMDTLLQKSYQQFKFSPDGHKIIADIDTFYLIKKNSLKLSQNYESPQLRMRRFRQQPKTSSEADVQSMLKKNDFYCDEYPWNKAFCNPNGHDFANQYRLETIQGDKVVMDQASGLMWQQGGSNESMYFEAAKKWIKNLNQQGYAGFKDWRLPTLEEVMSLMEPKEFNGDLYIDPIFDKIQRYIWTADPFAGSAAAWGVGFFNGCGPSYLSVDGYVRAVRSGQSSQE